MHRDSRHPDIVIIGSGIGGATMAYGLADSGLSILILESGKQMPDSPDNDDQQKIFSQQHFKPDEVWFDKDNKAFRPGNYYYVGGNSKFYGAVLARYRQEDFEEMIHEGGVSPAWPFGYAELEPWYCAAEKLYRVRGDSQADPTEPPRSHPYDFAAIEDEADIAIVRRRLQKQGLSPYSLPLAVDIAQWRQSRKVPWDAHPHYFNGKFDAETAALSLTASHSNIQLLTGSKVISLKTAADGGRIEEVVYQRDNQTCTLRPKLVILSAGAVHSAALLLKSKNTQYPNGLANRSGMVGRNFMNHNCTAVVGFSHRYCNRSVYQKTFGLNDFYLSDGQGGYPLGNIQLLGRVSGQILKSSLPAAPGFALNYFSRHSIDFYAMSEDLPSPENRIQLDGDKITLHWERNNWAAHTRLVKKLSAALKKCGFYFVMSKPFDKRTPSHQCGTVRMGTDPERDPLNSYCQAWEHENLYVVDASFMPSSAAVNPSLTIAAQALRVADYIMQHRLAE